ncbi:WbqC family protein [Persicobacter psychrovividus]|uniref:WbqC-like protein n=1 Tax=Persicobacter psychrovividus TaxID=387638 RepID=A0ABM7VGL5_9BACT|nr:hypothetical protein PEPS_23820 [Persicobacter psychrovividus]
MFDLQNKEVLLDLHYLPSVEYFAAIIQSEKLLIEAQENFSKQTYRNRCRILTSQGVRDLTIPMVAGNKRHHIQKILLDDRQQWRKIHWRSIKTAYGKAPFFEHYIDFLEPVFFGEQTTLFEFNLSLLKVLFKLLGIKKEISLTDEYAKYSDSDKIIDMRDRLQPKVDYDKNGILVPFPYPQLFGNEFVSNLSVLDLLFCEGPNARNVIQQSVKCK